MSKRKISIEELLSNLKNHGVGVIQLVPGSEIGFILTSNPTKIATNLPQESIPDVLQAVARRNEIITHFYEIRRKGREAAAQRKSEAGQ